MRDACFTHKRASCSQHTPSLPMESGSMVTVPTINKLHDVLLATLHYFQHSPVVEQLITQQCSAH